MACCILLGIVIGGSIYVYRSSKKLIGINDGDPLDWRSLDQPAVRRSHLTADKLIDSNKLVQLVGTCPRAGCTSGDQL